MDLRVRGISTAVTKRLQAGGLDSNGQAPLARSSSGLDPCRHCLEIIAEGDQKLVLGYRPFPDLQPYAETGPIFLHRKACARYDSESLPSWFAYLEPALVRGYDGDDWIRYETGNVVPGSELGASVASILCDESINYVHVRSKYGCFQCRVDRG